jgi:hypothetical protein
LAILFLYILLCSKSCSDDKEQANRQEEEVMAARDSIRSEFEAGYLSEEARYASEVKAIQNLKDLADYLEIYADVSLDSLFRQKAGDMIRNMFISEDTRLSFGHIKNKKMKTVSLEEFLDKGFGDKLISAEVIFDSINVAEPLQKLGEEAYSGKLAAYQTIYLCTATDTIFLPSCPLTIEILSSKKAKKVGNDTLMVWILSFGDMRKID